MTGHHPHTVIGGVRYSCLDRKGAAEWLKGAALSGRGGHVCVTGAHGVVTAQDDARFRAALNSAAMNTLDGQPVVWVARARGFKAGRVTGRELVWDIAAADAEGQIGHVLFGATRDVTDRMTQRLRMQNPNLRIEAINPPFGPLDDAYLDAACAPLAARRATIVWVGLSTPKQEILAQRLSQRLPALPVVAIGAGFDHVADMNTDQLLAPRIVTLLCLEWFLRLLAEPHRLFRRYATVVPRFGLVLARDMWRRPRHA